MIIDCYPGSFIVKSGAAICPIVNPEQIRICIGKGYEYKLALQKIPAAAAAATTSPAHYPATERTHRVPGDQQNPAFPAGRFQLHPDISS